jgi:2-dehydropantoate 2-reductase
MRILVLGAGGIGGYFGALLARGGADVTFLVRPRRAAQLREQGLVIESPLGNFQVPARPVLREDLAPGWDAIILACKAYDLDDAIETLRPVAAGALIVPQLNGIRHLEVLDAAFGADAVCGGMTQIGVVMEPDGRIRHLALTPIFRHGPRSAGQKARAERLQQALAAGGEAFALSDAILRDMWEKFTFLATLAAMTCLMRAPIGAISATSEGAAQTLAVLEDCAAAAAAAGYPPRSEYLRGLQSRLTDPGSPLAASMLRDLTRGGKIEGEHIVGDILARARAAGREAPLLAAAHTQLEAYVQLRG